MNSQSRLGVRALIFAVLAGGLMLAVSLLDLGLSDSAQIETTDVENPEQAVAVEQVGAEDLPSAGTLQIGGIESDTSDPGETSDPDKNLVAGAEAAIEVTTGDNAPEAGSTTTTTTTIKTTTGGAPGLGQDQDQANLSSDDPTESESPSTSNRRTATTASALSSTPASAEPGTEGRSTGPTTRRSTTQPAESSGPVDPATPSVTNPAATESTNPRSANPRSTNPGATSTTSTTPSSANPGATSPVGSPGSVAPALIPYVHNGVGDGATGGRQPYTPPRARLGFQDVADQNPSTVQASCGSSSVDCAAAIKSIMRSNRARPLKITFGSSSRRGAEVSFKSPLILESGVMLEGINQPRVVVTGGANLFTVSGTKNVSIRNFDLDMQRCASGNGAVVMAASAVENLYLSGINVINAQPNSTDYCSKDFLRLNFTSGTAKNIHLYDIEISRLHRFVRVQADVDTIRVYNNVIREIGREGYTQTEASFSRNVFIEGNIFSKHSPKAIGGHMIGFPISKAASPKTYARNVIVRNNLVEGRPNVAHLKDPQTLVVTPNGAAGDLIALRGIDGFLLEGNVVRHSGEVGITATAGLRNGTIRYNQVSYTDTTGIVLGNEARNSNEKVTRVDVYRNEMFQNSLDRSREFTDRDHPTFSLWNTTNSCMVNNYIHNNGNSNGFWVWNGNNATWPASVFDVYIADNQFKNNVRDFVESSNARGPYAVASPTGGTNWTSTYAGSVDRDNDGLPTQCVTETNDNDPCVPDIYSEACRR